MRSCCRNFFLPALSLGRGLTSVQLEKGASCGAESIQECQPQASPAIFCCLVAPTAGPVRSPCQQDCRHLLPPPTTTLGASSVGQVLPPAVGRAQVSLPGVPGGADGGEPAGCRWGRPGAGSEQKPVSALAVPGLAQLPLSTSPACSSQGCSSPL